MIGLHRPTRSSFQLGKFLRKIIPTIFRRRPRFSPHLKLQILEKGILPSQIEFKFDELHNATNGFSQKIGAGGFGSVYGGILSDGRRVAVKMSNNESRQDETARLNELKTLTRLKHRNIAGLVGYCFKDNLMLVYDYMPRNLGSVIFDAGEDEMIIDWPTRHNIILDIIKGLTYLQEGADLCIVHRDIKPWNILLDENLNAKICDFGAARILQSCNTQNAKEISTDGGAFPEEISNFSSHETTVVGTIGYLDPEYFETSFVTPKSDIYSFGVLVLNVISGKRAWINIEDEMWYLTMEAWRLHEMDRLTELIDPRLIKTEGLIYSSSILRTIRIALWCVKAKPEMRPSASQVLKMLSSEEEIPIPAPDQSFYECYPKDEISACTSPCGKSCIAEPSVADDHYSEQEIHIPISPVESYVVDEHFSEEGIAIPTLPLESSSADDKFSQEEICIAAPPINSLLLMAITQKRRFPLPNPPLESLVI